MKTAKNKIFESGVFQWNKAFTLSEVLITLGIIGVVAALTIPALMNSTSEKELKTAWKKNYSDISNALTLVRNENGGDLVYDQTVPGFHSFFDDLSSHLSYSQKFPANGGWHAANAWKGLDGTPCGVVNGGSPLLILNNGVIILFGGFNGQTFDLIVDVNGKKGPNVIGRDIFSAQVKMKESTYKAFGTELNQSVLSFSSGNACSLTNTTEIPCDNTTLGWTCSAEYLYK